MHETSYGTMAMFRQKYLPGPAKLKVLDVGSLNINGTYKPIFYDKDYKGLDVVEGQNVDIQVSYPYQWDEIKSGSFDVVVSGQTLEHVEDDKRLVKEMARCLKFDGYMCIIVPSAGPKHMEQDYRRYTVESLSNLVKSAGLKVLECNLNPHGMWQDITVVAQKLSTIIDDKIDQDQNQEQEQPKDEKEDNNSETASDITEPITITITEPESTSAAAATETETTATATAAVSKPGRPRKNK